MNDVKPGYRTTEFWLTLLAQVVPLLTLFGVLSAEEGQLLADAVAQTVAAVFALVAAVAPIIQYIRSRTQVKEAESQVREAQALNRA